MKLKSGFVLIPFEDKWLALAADSIPELQNAIITLNKSAHFCWLRLEKGIDKATLLRQMCAAFDAPVSQLEQDLETFLEVLREHGLLEEGKND